MMIGKDMASRILERGLEAASLRQRILANNIANVGTAGFKRSRVEFEDQLAVALSEGKDPDSVAPTVAVDEDSLGRPDGNNVDVELEMTRMAENNIYYAALTRELSEQFARLRMAIDGRR